LNGRPIQRLAIVNRGESAMRCIRAVKAMAAEGGRDIQAIALFTDADRDAPFVRHADSAVRLPSPDGAVAAYLNHETLIAALREARADAVWPGWGFVAEDYTFVARLRDEQIAFLGPSPDAMRSLGDKITSKELAERAGVPVTAWSKGVVVDERDAVRHADKIGYPVVIKASAGGGGRGIRMVDSKEELAEAFRSAAAEAKGAFGDDRLFIEKKVTGGRHIEVQIAADSQGNVLAVGSRDCSVQRRHQKVLEEAPPPGLDPEIIEALETAASRLAAHVSYVGVGTVEFLVSDDGFYFLEVNPRLQVEHGITEEVTGVDLVQLQIRIAEGESIKDLHPVGRGVAIEARVNAEDPDQGFLPSPGRIARFDPALGPRVRVDSGVAVGTTVPPDFDSLIAKVIATGATRAEARARLSCALRDFELVVEGGASNKGYLLEVLDADDYRAGPVDTLWLDRWNAKRAGLPSSRADLSPDALVAAAILVYQRIRGTAREHFWADASGITPDRIPPNSGQQIDLTFEGESYRLMVYAIGSWRYRVHLDDRAVSAKMQEEGEHGARLEIDERVHRILYDANEVGLRVEVDGHPHRFGTQTAGQVRAGTPAMVVAIQVAVGDRVEVGQPLGLVEAMKMEIAFTAPVAGTVTEINIRQGQQVTAGDVILSIDPGSEETEQDRTGASARLALPPQRDPLALLFREHGEESLAVPDLLAADRAVAEGKRDSGSAWRDAMGAVRDEIRRVVLGYDANPARCESLIDFIDAPLPETLSREACLELAEIRHDLIAFANVERLFIRAPRASVSGGLGPSNNARLRMYVRRMRAEGAGIAEEFLDLVLGALSHYGISDLTPTDALERAVLRMLSTQFEPELRHSLAMGMLRRVTALSEAGVDLSGDQALAEAIDALIGMRGLLSDAMADSALEARYAVFERREAELQAEQSSKALEAWLDAAERAPTKPSANVLIEVAAAARRVFDRVGRWIKAPDPGRLDIALAAYVQRVYAPSRPTGHMSVKSEDTWIHCVEYPDKGLVLAATGGESEIAAVARHLARTAARLAERGPTVFALELLVPTADGVDEEAATQALAAVLAETRPPARFTLDLHQEDGHNVYHTFGPARDEQGLLVADEPPVLRDELYGLHPETAERIGLGRYAKFELERVPSEEGIYCFHGRARDVEGDERIFVLADARERSPLAGPELAHHLAAFERVFNRAARCLRTTLRERDPRRALHWNRIALYVSAELFLDPDAATEVARRLAPATRHLGLEKVLVGLNLKDRDNLDGSSRQVEVVISESTGDEIQLSWRDPHHEALEPVGDYERRVVAARRRRLVYPYEIIRMLTSDQRGIDDSSERVSIAQGTFEEFDLDPTSEHSKAVSVAGREPGGAKAGVVFGVITTPTEKVPEGMQRVLILSDPTMGMGSLSIPECDRVAAAIDLAEELGLPVEWLPVSSGAKIAMDSGTENLDATARVVRRIVTFTEKGGVIHLIVQGMNIGAQSYWDALATMLMHTRGVLIMTPRASMVLTGAAALAASGSVSAEDEVAIGGYEQIMGPNGQAQYYARNLAEAYRLLYDYYRFSYVVPGESGPRPFETSDPVDRNVCESPLSAEESFDFATVGEIFDDATNPGRKRPFSMRAVMQALIDRDGGQLERWNQMVAGETSIIWDAHLGGRPVTLIGIESHVVPREGYRPFDGPESWTGGTLFPNSSKKTARAINAASGNRPVVVLANLSGFDGSPESLRKLQLEYGAEIARAIVNFDGPILFLVVSRYHGGAYVVFSQELNDNLKASALSGSYASVIGGGAAASVVFKREVRARALADPRVLEKQRAVRVKPSAAAREALDAIVAEVTLEMQSEVAREFDEIHSVERAREVGSLDCIISPNEMRSHLISEIKSGIEPGPRS
jgi:acetyl/propionyl-CoA carboxylase alpha subunit/acetyl-CoA carboxylase carboxyltransferase component